VLAPACSPRSAGLRYVAAAVVASRPTALTCRSAGPGRLCFSAGLRRRRRPSCTWHKVGATTSTQVTA
jgi:hypothetical protein